MARPVNLAEARRRLPELVDRAAGGDAVVLARRGRPTAVIVSLHEHERARKAGLPRTLPDRSLRGSFKLVGTWADFERDLREIRAKMWR